MFPSPGYPAQRSIVANCHDGIQKILAEAEFIARLDVTFSSAQAMQEPMWQLGLHEVLRASTDILGGPSSGSQQRAVVRMTP
jgi:hypothetical protein